MGPRKSVSNRTLHFLMPALGLVQLFPVPRPQTVSSQTRLLVSPLGPLHQQGWTRVDIEKELVSNYAFL